MSLHVIQTCCAFINKQIECNHAQFQLQGRIVLTIITL